MRANLLFMLSGAIIGLLPNISWMAGNMNYGLKIELFVIAWFFLVYIGWTIRNFWFVKVIRYLDHFYIIKKNHLERIPNDQLNLLAEYGYKGINDHRIKIIGAKKLSSHGPIKQKFYISHDFSELKRKLKKINFMKIHIFIIGFFLFFGFCFSQDNNPKYYSMPLKKVERAYINLLLKDNSGGITSYNDEKKQLEAYALQSCFLAYDTNAQSWDTNKAGAQMQVFITNAALDSNFKTEIKPGDSTNALKILLGCEYITKYMVDMNGADVGDLLKKSEEMFWKKDYQSMSIFLWLSMAEAHPLTQPKAIEFLENLKNKGII